MHCVGNSITRWGQKDLPTDATAIFGPETEPATNSATQARPGNDGYKAMADAVDLQALLGTP